MQTGLSLQKLAEEIQFVRQNKHDLIAPTSHFRMDVTPLPEVGAISMIEVDGQGSFNVSDLAHEQIASKLKIPRKYYQRMLQEAPDLLEQSVNTWLKQHGGRHMLRTLSGNLRAVLSDAYRPLDNDMVAEAALPVLLDHKNEIEVTSTKLTDKRLYIQAKTPQLQADIRSGDTVQAGVVISNSEVGCGALNIETMIYRLVCANGLIAAKALRKTHLGRRVGSDDEAATYDMFKNDTIAADNHAFMLAVRDAVGAAFSEEVFTNQVNKMRAAAGVVLPANKVNDTVIALGNKYDLTELETEGVLERLIAGSDLTQYGLANAVTSLANSNDIDYDRVVELERMGGSIIDMPERELVTLYRS